MLFSAPQPGTKGGGYHARRIQRAPDAFLPLRIRTLTATAGGPPDTTGKVLAPLLVEARKEPAATESVIVLLQDPIPMPWLLGASPRHWPWSPQSPQSRLLQRLVGERESIDALWLATVSPSWQVHEFERAWIAQAISISVRAGAIESLAADPRVRFVEPRFRPVAMPMGCRVQPPGNGQRPTCAAVQPPPTTSPWTFAKVASHINLDHYLSLGLTSSRIAIFDSGIHKGHILFDNSQTLGQCRDCVGGDANCEGGNVEDIDGVHWGHGTKSASLLAAGCSYGPDYQGLSNGPVDVMRVYQPPSGGLDCPLDTNPGALPEAELDLVAVWRAIQVATVQLHDDILVFETQLRCQLSPTLDTYAQNAFLGGAVVIAANGNGPDLPVGAPARVPGALGIGFCDIHFPTDPGSHSRDRINGRFKPDLIAPSNYEAASNHGDPRHALDYLGSTSGAAPVAAATAGSLLSWMRDIWWGFWTPPGPIPPGQVYAQMILAADTPWSSVVADGFQLDRGAGFLSMPTDGVGSWGSVVLGASDPPLTFMIPGPEAGAKRVDAALWWFDSGEPNEAASDQSFRSDYDLTILAPPGSGIPDGVSHSHGGVFERASTGVSGGAPAAGGLWQLQIKCVSASGGPRVVYWAASIR
jgi:hypothetical protein